jgi:hypothetical protein
MNKLQAGACRGSLPSRSSRAGPLFALPEPAADEYHPLSPRSFSRLIGGASGDDD